MATIKSYTDLEQSKKLAKILQLESADMVYEGYKNELTNEINYIMGLVSDWKSSYPDRNIFNDWNDTFIPCWSLAALLSILPKKYYPVKGHNTDLILGKPKDKWCILYWDATGMQDGEQTLADNPVDACVEMILKLHELKIL